MAEKLSKYESLVKEHEILSILVNGYAMELRKYKDNSEIRNRYNTYNKQINEVRKEIMKYERIKKYAKREDYKKVSEMSFDNPELKEVLSKEDLLGFANYCEGIVKKITGKNKNLILAKKSLERKVSNLLESVEGGKIE